MIESNGGKEIKVRVDGNEVLVELNDLVNGRCDDALLTPEAALTLAELLTVCANKAAVGDAS